MRAHVIDNGRVVNTIVVNSLDDLPGLISAENGGTIGDTWDGETFTTPTLSPPSADELIATMTSDLEAYYDQVAAIKDYDSRITCAMRAGYEGPYQADGILS